MSNRYMVAGINHEGYEFKRFFETEREAASYMDRAIDADCICVHAKDTQTGEELK